MLNNRSTLNEIITQICSFDQVSKREYEFLLVYNSIDFFRKYINYCFNLEDSSIFSNLASNFKYENKFSKNKSVLTDTRLVIVKYLPTLQNKNSMQVRIKQDLFRTLLDEIDTNDVELLIGMINGKYLGNQKINKLFVTKALQEKSLL